MKHFRMIPLFFCLIVTLGAAENLLTNPSFEETVPYKKGRYSVELVKGWQCFLNDGDKYCDISLVHPGQTGSNALRLQTRGKELSRLPGMPKTSRFHPAMRSS